MNIKLAENLLRFRVSPVELDKLLLSQNITLKIDIDVHPILIFEIHAVQKLNPILKLVQKDSATHLLVKQEALTNLKAKLPTKEMLTCNWINKARETIQLIFEVDVRKKRDAANPPFK